MVLFDKHARTKVEGLIKGRLIQITSSPLLGYLVPFLPYRSSENAYLVPKVRSKKVEDSRLLPVPPKDLWLGYGQTVDAYLDSGKRHVDRMLQLLEAEGWSISENARVLDFGCGAGRMTRWLIDYAATAEIWGTDVSAEHIVWLKQHFPPSFRFITTTMTPHLPFEDNYFHLVYAGSVFSHIDDLADAWFLELRRITRKNGLLYISVMDKTTIRLLGEPEWQSFWLSWYLYGQERHRNFMQSDFAYFTLGRALRTQIFYDLDYIVERLSAWFEVVSVHPAAYGFQTVLILRKRKS